MKTNIQFLPYLSQFFLQWEMLETNFVEKIKTHILYSVTNFRKSCRLGDNVEKYCRTEQATDDNMAHAHCMLGVLIVYVKAGLFFILLDAGRLAKSQYFAGPVTGPLEHRFCLVFPVYWSKMLGWFPILPSASTCFTCSPPYLNFNEKSS
jgi:hypothetical protein